MVQAQSHKVDVGVANTNPRFISIVASTPHQKAMVRQFFYVKTLHAAHSNA